MQWTGLRAFCACLAATGILAGVNLKGSPQQPAAQSQAAKPVGTITAISGSTITLRLDAGTDVNVIVRDSPRLLRVAPQQTDLSNATPIEYQDLQVGDRILVTGRLAEDGKSVLASAIVAMKASDLQAKQQKERLEWQRGAGGIVRNVDAAVGTISISVPTPGGVRTVAIRTTKDTAFRRYAPGSVSFEDAKPSSLNQIKLGDQLRARGTRSDDGSEFAAAEIIFGSFRNISGTVISVDSAANALRVTDLATKKPVLVKITPNSQVRQLPPEIARRIAMQLRMGKAGDSTGMQATSQPARTSMPGNAGTEQPRIPGGGGRPPELQQILGRLPQSALADFQKGDAVMIVSTEDASPGEATAITLVGGIEPILTSPGGSQAMTLSPWTLGGGFGEGEAGGR